MKDILEFFGGEGQEEGIDTDVRNEVGQNPSTLV